MFSALDQRGSVVEILNAWSEELICRWKMEGRVEEEFDIVAKSYLICMKDDYGMKAKMSLPANVKDSLGLKQPCLFLQIYLPTGADFSIDIGVVCASSLSCKWIKFSTVQTEATITSFCIALPLKIDNRNMWTHFGLYLLKIVKLLYENDRFLSLESVVLSGTCNIRHIYTMQNHFLKGEEGTDEALCYSAALPYSFHFREKLPEVYLFISDDYIKEFLRFRKKSSSILSSASSSASSSRISIKLKKQRHISSSRISTSSARSKRTITSTDSHPSYRRKCFIPVGQKKSGKDRNTNKLNSSEIQNSGTQGNTDYMKNMHFDKTNDTEVPVARSSTTPLSKIQKAQLIPLNRIQKAFFHFKRILFSKTPKNQSNINFDDCEDISLPTKNENNYNQFSPESDISDASVCIDKKLLDGFVPILEAKSITMNNSKNIITDAVIENHVMYLTSGYVANKKIENNYAAEVPKDQYKDSKVESDALQVHRVSETNNVSPGDKDTFFYPAAYAKKKVPMAPPLKDMFLGSFSSPPRYDRIRLLINSDSRLIFESHEVNRVSVKSPLRNAYKGDPLSFSSLEWDDFLPGLIESTNSDENVLNIIFEILDKFLMTRYFDILNSPDFSTVRQVECENLSPPLTSEFEEKPLLFKCGEEFSVPISNTNSEDRYFDNVVKKVDGLKFMNDSLVINIDAVKSQTNGYIEPKVDLYFCRVHAVYRADSITSLDSDIDRYIAVYKDYSHIVTHFSEATGKDVPLRMCGASRTKNDGINRIFDSFLFEYDPQRQLDDDLENLLSLQMSEYDEKWQSFFTCEYENVCISKADSVDHKNCADDNASEKNASLFHKDLSHIELKDVCSDDDTDDSSRCSKCMLQEYCQHGQLSSPEEYEFTDDVEQHVINSSSATYSDESSAEDSQFSGNLSCQSFNNCSDDDTDDSSRSSKCKLQEYCQHGQLSSPEEYEFIDDVEQHAISSSSATSSDKSSADDSRFSGNLSCPSFEQYRSFPIQKRR